jgi:hypothetical protein
MDDAVDGMMMMMAIVSEGENEILLDGHGFK